MYRTLGPRIAQQLEPLLPVLEMELSDDFRFAFVELVLPGSVAANYPDTA